MRIGIEKKLICMILVLIMVTPDLLVYASEIATARNMSIYKISGEKKGVTIKRKNKNVSGAEGSRLSKDDELNTDNDTECRLQIDDDKVVYVAKSTKVAVSTVKKKSLALSLVSGEAYIQVSNSIDEENSLSINAGGSVMGVKGTQFYVSNRFGSQNISVTSGSVTLQTAVVKAILKPGTTTTINPDGTIKDQKPITVEELSSFALAVMLELMQSDAETQNDQNAKDNIVELLGGESPENIARLEQILKQKMEEENKTVEDLITTAERLKAALESGAKPVMSTIEQAINPTPQPTSAPGTPAPTGTGTAGTVTSTTTPTDPPVENTVIVQSESALLAALNPNSPYTQITIPAGQSIILTQNLTIPGAPSPKTLLIQPGATLTNNTAITVDGSLINEGTIDGTGTIDNTSMNTFENVGALHAGTFYNTGRFINNNTAVFEVGAFTNVGRFVNESSLTFTYTSFSNTLTAVFENHGTIPSNGARGIEFDTTTNGASVINTGTISLMSIDGGPVNVDNAAGTISALNGSLGGKVVFTGSSGGVLPTLFSSTVNAPETLRINETYEFTLDGIGWRNTVNHITDIDTLLYAISSAAGTAVLDVEADITIDAAGGLDAAVEIASGKDITLRSKPGDNFALSRSGTLTLPLIAVSDATLRLSNITLDGKRDVNTNPSSIVSVFDNGQLIIENGTILQNQIGTAVNIDGGDVTMNDGSIINNENSTDTGGTGDGGGVYVSRTGTFNMIGGTISGNSAKNGGGICTYGGTINMYSGAVIDGNTASEYGGGVYVDQDLVLYQPATFNMYGGTIYGSRARYGGGGAYITALSLFDMQGGTISGNSVDVGGYGAGLRLDGGKLNMSGSAIIGQTDTVYLNNGYINVTAPLTGMPPVMKIEPSTNPLSSASTDLVEFYRDVEAADLDYFRYENTDPRYVIGISSGNARVLVVTNTL